MWVGAKRYPTTPKYLVFAMYIDINCKLTQIAGMNWIAQNVHSEFPYQQHLITSSKVIHCNDKSVSPLPGTYYSLSIGFRTQ